MSRVVIVILIYRYHKPIDSIIFLVSYTADPLSPPLPFHMTQTGRPTRLDYETNLVGYIYLLCVSVVFFRRGFDVNILSVVCFRTLPVSLAVKRRMNQ
jgi:hypothetical protein